MFRNAPKKGEERKGEKRELLRNTKAGCYGGVPLESKSCTWKDKDLSVLFHAAQSNRVHWEMPSLYH